MPKQPSRRSNTMAMLLLTLLLCACQGRPNGHTQAENRPATANSSKHYAKTQHETTAEAPAPIPDTIIRYGNGNVLYTLLQEIDEDELYDSRSIYGMWFVPHFAEEHIIFHKNHHFQYDAFTMEGQKLTSQTIMGTYRMKGDSVLLQAPDGWTLGLRMWNPWGRTSGNALTAGNEEKWKLYLVKGTD